MVVKKRIVWNKGIPQSKEAKEKNRLAHLGKKHTEEWKERQRKNAKINPNYGMKGKHHIEETLKKMHLWKKGNKPWNKGLKGKKYLKHYKENRTIGWNNGDIPWNKGYGDYIKRSKNPNWLGGISFEPYGIEFDTKLKEQIRKRDNYRCQECFRHQNELFTKNKNRKIVNQKLHIHHIDFNKQNNNPNNLISLCRSCHAQTQFNRESWTNYFQDKIIQQGGLK